MPSTALQSYFEEQRQRQHQEDEGDTSTLQHLSVPRRSPEPSEDEIGSIVSRTSYQREVLNSASQRPVRSAGRSSSSGPAGTTRGMAPRRDSVISATSVDDTAAEGLGGGGSNGSSSVDPALAKYTGDLRRALEEANQKKSRVQERLRAFEVEAEGEDAELQLQLRSAKAALESVRTHAAASARQDLRNKRVHSEIREVESERDAMIRASSALQSELMQARAQAQMQAASAPDPNAIVAQAASMEAAETSLRAEAAALRSALALCEKRHEDNARARVREAEALRRHQEAQLEERRELEAAEERLRIGRACAADALALRLAASTRAASLDSAGSCSPEQLRHSALQVEQREEECKHAQLDLEELHEECGQLLRLNGAAEARVEELEQRLAHGGLKATAERAVALLKRLDHEARARGLEELRGAARLTLVLAQICGVPRMAYLALDSNRSGRVSMCEFDSGLRLRFGLDYEAIAAMERPVLRSLFKEFDIRRRGYLIEEDFARCYPEIWTQYGREGWPISAAEHHFNPPNSKQLGGESSPAGQARNRSAPVGARRR